MHQRPVAVVLRSLFKSYALGLSCLLGLILPVGSASANENESAYTVDRSVLDISPAPNGYLARILNDSPEEITAALKRAEDLHKLGNFDAAADPLVIVLHGHEVEVFFKDEYSKYQEIVDLAAKLSALGVVDVRVCETQTGVLGRSPANLHSFISTVPFGPSEVRRLLNRGNVSF